MFKFCVIRNSRVTPNSKYNVFEMSVHGSVRASEIIKSHPIASLFAFRIKVIKTTNKIL